MPASAVPGEPRELVHHASGGPKNAKLGDVDKHIELARCVKTIKPKDQTNKGLSTSSQPSCVGQAPVWRIPIPMNLLEEASPHPASHEFMGNSWGRRGRFLHDRDLA